MGSADCLVIYYFTGYTAAVRGVLFVVVGGEIESLGGLGINFTGSNETHIRKETKSLCYTKAVGLQVILLSS